MTDFHIPDDIICNIAARLPAKPLLRFQCVSRHWYRRLREPNFMKLRSRKIIILPLDYSLKLIDDTSNLTVDRCHHWHHIERYKITVIGTLNGLVLLAMLEYLTVYNPLTGASRLLPRPPSAHYKDACGFGYGASPDDLKIVRFSNYLDAFDVYNFREGSWSKRSMPKYLNFEYPVGRFVNGFLYWIAYDRSVLIAVNVKDMAISEIHLPFKIRRGVWLNPLGIVDGCLCSLQPITNKKFDMWVMKEQNLWSILYSFELVGLPLHDIYPHYAIGILENKRILMRSPCSENVIIYDASKGSYKTLSISISTPCYSYFDIWFMQAFEYVESLVSPTYLCPSSVERRRRRWCKGDKSGNNIRKKRSHASS